MKIILAPFQDPALGEDWDKQAPRIEKSLSGILKEAGVEDVRIEQTNHGRGADWPTFTLLLLADLYFRVPEFYQRVQDANAGWKRIWRIVKGLLGKLGDEYPIVGLSDEVLLLLAIDHIAEKWDVDAGALMLVGMKSDLPVPEPPDLEEVNRAVLFTLSRGKRLYQVALNERGSILWSQLIDPIP